MSQTEVQLIKDSTIVNADISNSAAIDVSKVTGAMPLAGGSFTNDVTFTGDSANIVFDKSDSALEFADNAKALFGTGNDLQIIHDGSNSFIAESGTGNLVISTTAGSIRIEKNTGEPMIHANVDGAVELYHDNSKKFETTSGGGTVTGRLLTDGVSMGDSEELLLGTGNDFKLRHDGTDNHIVSANGDINIQVADTENAIIAKPNGAVELYHNNVKKIETTANGIEVIGTITDDGTTHDGDVLFTGASANVLFDKSDSALEFADNAKAIFGSGNDLQIYHDGSSSYIDEVGTGSLKIQTNGTGVDIQKGSSETIARFIADGAVELYHNNSKKFETTSTGVTVTGSLTTTGNIDAGTANFLTDDNGKFISGSAGDLQIFHDATNSHITNSTGNLDVASGSNINLKVATSENAIVCTANGAVELYHNNSKKLNTESYGVNITGHCDVNGGDLTLEDNRKARFGNGDDLQIYHDGSNSYLVNTTGELNIRNQTRIKLRTDQFVLNNNANDESIIYAAANGAVELYHDNSKKFQTQSTGVRFVAAHTFMDDNFRARFGANDDLQIYHDGTNTKFDNTTGKLLINTSADLFGVLHGSDDAIISRVNGAVELYNNGSKKLETTSTGATVTGNLTANTLLSSKTSGAGLSFADNVELNLGTGDDLQIFHDGTNTMIDNDTGDLKISSSGTLRLRGDNVGIQNENQTETMAFFNVNGAAKLYFDNSERFETTSSGATVTGRLATDGVFIGDGGNNNTSLSIGANNDLRLFHDGSNSHILDRGTGSLLIKGDSVNIGADSGEFYFRGFENGSSVLRFDNSTKLETKSTGVIITGNDASGSENLGSFFFKTASGTVRGHFDTSNSRFALKDNILAAYGNSNDLQIYHDGTNSRIDNTTGALIVRTTNSFLVQSGNGGEVLIDADVNGGVNLYFDNSLKLNTNSNGVRFHGNLEGVDNDKIRLGNSEDLQIYHDGSNSVIEDSGTGNLNILTSALAVKNAAGNENMIVASQNGGVELYHNGTKKFETSSEGTKHTLSNDGTIRYDQTTTANNRFQNFQYSRSGSNRGDVSQIQLGEGNSSEGRINIKTSPPNAGMSGGVFISNGGTSFGSLSDIRLKTKVADISNALTDIAKIDTWKYTWNSDTSSTVHLGITAQSVNEVYPEVVEQTNTMNDDPKDTTEYLAVLHQELIPVCIAAIKELKSKVEELQSEVATLKAA
tara:strand:- start:1214 stop:4831 length:3618 start_codon:yes stop_codon:yes gene_type:complete